MEEREDVLGVRGQKFNEFSAPAQPQKSGVKTNETVGVTKEDLEKEQSRVRLSAHPWKFIKTERGKGPTVTNRKFA